MTTPHNQHGTPVEVIATAPPFPCKGEQKPQLIVRYPSGVEDVVMADTIEGWGGQLGLGESRV